MDQDRKSSATTPVGAGRTATYKIKPRPDLQVLRTNYQSIHVEVVGGPMDGRGVTVTGGTLTIGREEGNDFVLALDSMVSAQHSRIVKEDEHFWLEDLESRNGTYFGDERIQAKALIGPGTLFTVGKTCLEFMPQ